MRAPLSRRRALAGLLGTLIAACRPRTPGEPATAEPDSPDTAPDSEPTDSADTTDSAADTGDCDPPEPGSAEEGWWSVDLSKHPELLTVGGQAAVDIDEALLHVLVVHLTEGCYIAVWRICTHGACEVSWDGEVDAVRCPCHDSLFGSDGSVLTGPATEPLKSWPVAREGDLLWIHRPL